MNNTKRPRRHLVTAAMLLLTALAVGTAYAAQSDWIFCTSFESPGTSCSGGVGPITQDPTSVGNLWDSMHWDEGKWQ